jgi:N-acetylneuraminic acid mutarotase
VIGGKGVRDEIVNYTQRYNIETNTWELLSPNKHRRYASCAVYMKNANKIFLVGGRGDSRNTMH